jgi:hypothetical protein
MKSKEFYASSAWKACRDYILLLHGNYSNGSWYVKCATGGGIKQFPNRNIHVGHYIKVIDGTKTNFATALDERNMMPQTAAHNRYHGGKQDLMAISIDEYWGRGTVEELNIKRHNMCKLGKFELEIIKKDYDRKYLELANKKGDPFGKITRLENKFKKHKRP